MKKLIFYTALIIGLLVSSCTQYDMDKAEAAVKLQIRYNDPSNGTITKISRIKAISYEEIPEDKRENPDEEYLCRVFLQGTWSYMNSYRVFNLDDTINCYFSSEKRFLRMDNIYVN